MGTTWNEKRLGFGLMRLPKKGEEIDLTATCALVDAYLAGGFNYFDTAYVYPGSEQTFRKAVAERYPRERYTVANKMAGWLLNDTLTPEAMFQEQLERCGVEYFDYYLLHSVQASRVAFYENFDCWAFCREKKEKGEIRSLGFSYHGDPELLDRLLTAHPEVDFVQLQINYVDWDSEAIFSGRNYEVCRKHGKDMVVMEPVKGGFLANLKPELAEEFQALDPNASPASYALRFVGSLPGIKMVLSGMNAMEQLTDNMNTFADFKPLSQAEQAAVKTVARGLLSMPVVPCTDCRYCCKGCPMGINIPDIFKGYNMLLTFGAHDRPHFYYDGLLATGSGRASACVGCGQCEAACPQHIPIIETLKKASALLDQ